MQGEETLHTLPPVRYVCLPIYVELEEVIHLFMDKKYVFKTAIKLDIVMLYAFYVYRMMHDHNTVGVCVPCFFIEPLLCMSTLGPLFEPFRTEAGVSL